MAKSLSYILAPRSYYRCCHRALYTCPQHRTLAACAALRGEDVSLRSVTLLRPPTVALHHLISCSSIRHTHFNAASQQAYSLQQQQLRSVRQYSSDGGKGESESGKGGGGGGGFFQNFVSNLRRGLFKDKEMQENLKGFQEETDKMQQSFVLQQARLKMGLAKDKVVELGSHSIEAARSGWGRFREGSSKVYKDVSETELAKKGHELGSQVAAQAQKTAEKVSEQAEELSKTDVGKTITKSAEVVKEDLLDDIILESGPYKPPEKILKRSSMASSETEGATTADTIQPNQDAKEVVLTRQSKWKQQWQSLRENNPVTNAFYNIKMKYDESDNLVIRASRVVTDKIGDTFGGVMTQSDMAEALAEIQKVDPSFNKEAFTKHCQFEIIPTVLEAYLRGDSDVLQDWCHEAAFNVLSAIIKQRTEPGVTIDCKILEVRDVDIVMAKLLDQGPVLVLTFQAQQLTVKTTGDKTDNVRRPFPLQGFNESWESTELLENIFYVWALGRDQTVYDPRTAWRVLEFGIQASGKLLV